MSVPQSQVWPGERWTPVQVSRTHTRVPCLHPSALSPALRRGDKAFPFPFILSGVHRGTEAG
jgi:hypothetical protein